MDGETKFSITSEKGTQYEFEKEPGINEAWHMSLPFHDQPGTDSVEIDTDIECVEPTVAHANFIDFFVERYATDFRAFNESYLPDFLEGVVFEENLEFIGISVHLPAQMISPVEWSIQYSYQSGEDHEFGMIIDFQDSEFVSFGMAD